MILNLIIPILILILICIIWTQIDKGIKYKKLLKIKRHNDIINMSKDEFNETINLSKRDLINISLDFKDKPLDDINIITKLDKISNNLKIYINSNDIDMNPYENIIATHQYIDKADIGYNELNDENEYGYHITIKERISQILEYLTNIQYFINDNYDNEGFREELVLFLNDIYDLIDTLPADVPILTPDELQVSVDGNAATTKYCIDTSDSVLDKRYEQDTNIYSDLNAVNSLPNINTYCPLNINTMSKINNAYDIERDFVLKPRELPKRKNNVLFKKTKNNKHRVLRGDYEYLDN